MEAEVESEAEIDMNAGMEMDSGIQIEAVPPEKQRAWRSQPLEEADMAAPSTIKKFTPKICRPTGEIGGCRIRWIRSTRRRRGQTHATTV